MRPTVAQWLKDHSLGHLRASYFGSVRATSRLEHVPFEFGDILMVPHGPWVYPYGVKEVDAKGRITGAVLLDAH